MWTDADARGFATRLAALAEVFAEPLTPVRVAGYRAALDDLAPTEVFAAIGTAAKGCRFFPKPVELREFVGEAHDLLRQQLPRHDSRNELVGGVINFDGGVLQPQLLDTGVHRRVRRVRERHVQVVHPSLDDAAEVACLAIHEMQSGAKIRLYCANGAADCYVAVAAVPHFEDRCSDGAVERKVEVGAAFHQHLHDRRAGGERVGAS